MNVPSRATVYVLADDLAGLNNPFIAQHGAETLKYIKVYHSISENGS